MSTKKLYKIGDEITTRISTTNTKRVGTKYKRQQLRIVGKVKLVKMTFGQRTYVITNGVVEDFATRTVLK